MQRRNQSYIIDGNQAHPHRFFTFPRAQNLNLANPCSCEPALNLLCFFLLNEVDFLLEHKKKSQVAITGTVACSHIILQLKYWFVPYQSMHPWFVLAFWISPLFAGAAN